jgi:hypothetical protein
MRSHLSCAEICTPLQSYLNLFEHPHSWKRQMLGWDTMIRFTFMCNETGIGIDANPGTSGNGNTLLEPNPSF